MTRFQIENRQSGTILGQYDADTEAQALDLMAQDAGYRDYADAQEAAPMRDGEITVTVVDA